MQSEKAQILFGQGRRRDTCVKFCDVDPGTDTLYAVCSDHVVSSSVEGSCGKTEDEGSSAA